MSLATLYDIHQASLSTWAEVDLKAIKHNLNKIKSLAGRHTEILCVVKGDAYGHGMVKVATLLDELGLGFFGVSDIEEGKILRRHGIKKPILLFESTLPAQAQQIIDYNLMPTVCTLEMAAALNRYAASLGKRVDVHIDIDTGMGRLGVWHEEAFDFVKKVMRLLSISIKGLYTHFPVADTNQAFTRKQIKILYDLVRRLDQHGLVVPYIHAANSMGLAGYHTKILNLARPGLMLYGLSPTAQLKNKINLKAVLSVKSKIVFVKNIRRGQGISYGHTFVAPRNMRVATIALGYKDGYLRCLSNKSAVLIAGKRCPVIGRVTMDQIMVDVSKLASVKVGSLAVILGTQNRNAISADELAGHAGTISYEIVCSLGSHLPRVYKI